MAKKTHTTAILLLSDGTHRYLNADRDLSNKEVWKWVREYVEYYAGDSVYISEMFLAYGSQSLRYTRNEIVELASQKA